MINCPRLVNGHSKAPESLQASHPTAPSLRNFLPSFGFLRKDPRRRTGSSRARTGVVHCELCLVNDTPSTPVILVQDASEIWANTV